MIGSNENQIKTKNKNKITEYSQDTQNDLPAMPVMN